MSPIDPISPVSPKPVTSDVESPVSPGKHEQPFQFPPAPQPKPPLHLPQLITSFNTAANIGYIRESSTQSRMQTPSPLRLDNGLQIALRSIFSHGHRRKGAISECHNSPREVPFPMDVAIAEELIDESSLWIHTVRAHEESGQPLADEENHVEGLEEIDVYMETPTAERSFQLPLWTNSVQDTMPTSPPPPYCCYPPPYQDNVNLRRQSISESQSSSTCVQPPSNKSTPTLISKPRSLSSRSRSGLRRRSSSFRCKPEIEPPLIVPNVNRIRLANSVAHLRTPLVPLISVRTGLAHPEFPLSILQYHLLTHEQLDSLARWYHQTIDAGRERWLYPAPFKQGKAWVFASSSLSESQRSRLLQQETGSRLSGADVDLETKRRRWGRFIGLRGCESPVEEEEVDVVMEDAETSGQQQEESLAERMEREWREALRRAEDENRVLDKIWRGRF